MFTKIIVGIAGGGHSDLKANLLKQVSDCADVIDGLTEIIMDSIEGAEKLSAEMLLDYANTVEETVQAARGITYNAVSKLGENDACEVVLATAEMCRSAMDLGEFLDDRLDEIMGPSDAVLSTAIETLDNLEDRMEEEDDEGSEEDEDGEDEDTEDGDGPAIFDAMIEQLHKLGLMGEDDVLTIRIEPAEGMDEADCSSEDQAATDKDLSSVGELIEKMADYFRGKGLMDENDVMTIAVESDDQ